MASSVARAGLTSFLKITAREVAADGVTINSAQPGTHWTDRVAKMVPDRETAASTVPARITGDADDLFRNPPVPEPASSSRGPACSLTEDKHPDSLIKTIL